MNGTDVLDGHFEVQCTSNYLPQETSQRHSSTQLCQHSPDEPIPAEREFTRTTSIEEEADYTLMPEWRNQRRQLFIFSNSGKPISSEINFASNSI